MAGYVSRDVWALVILRATVNEFCAATLGGVNLASDSALK
jgi:hypothetical protein